MIKFAVLIIVGIMPVVNLHQWDTQLENIVLPLLSDKILLHIQNYPNTVFVPLSAHAPISALRTYFRTQTYISVRVLS